MATTEHRASRWLAGLRPRRSAAPAEGPSTSALLARVGAPLHPAALDCVIAANVHGLYCVPRSSAHRPACQTILRGDVWEPETVALVCSTDPSGDVVTAGAFFGDLLPAIARSRQPGAHVWAFEPNRENHRCAQITVVLNGLQSVTVEHAALAEEAGLVTLTTADEDGVPLGGGSRVSDAPSAAVRTEQVQARSIDEMVPADRRVAVIQLDVEGHEQQALVGASRTIERWRPLLVVESTPSDAWVAANLTPLGYQPDGLVHWNRVFRATPS